MVKATVALRAIALQTFCGRHVCVCVCTIMVPASIEQPEADKSLPTHSSTKLLHPGQYASLHLAVTCCTCLHGQWRALLLHWGWPSRNDSQT